MTIVKASLLFHEKRLVEHEVTGAIAVAQVKIWKIPVSKNYPEGLKFSLFLVNEGKTVVGLDNHQPKGPHLHLGDRETRYLFRNLEMLQRDFWNLARKAGYSI